MDVGHVDIWYRIFILVVLGYCVPQPKFQEYFGLARISASSIWRVMEIDRLQRECSGLSTSSPHIRPDPTKHGRADGTGDLSHRWLAGRTVMVIAWLTRRISYNSENVSRHCIPAGCQQWTLSTDGQAPMTSTTSANEQPQLIPHSCQPVFSFTRQRLHCSTTKKKLLAITVSNYTTVGSRTRSWHGAGLMLSRPLKATLDKFHSASVLKPIVGLLSLAEGKWSVTWLG